MINRLRLINRSYAFGFADNELLNIEHNLVKASIAGCNVTKESMVDLLRDLKIKKEIRIRAFSNSSETANWVDQELKAGKKVFKTIFPNDQISCASAHNLTAEILQEEFGGFKNTVEVKSSSEVTASTKEVTARLVESFSECPHCNADGKRNTMKLIELGDGRKANYCTTHRVTLPTT